MFKSRRLIGNFGGIARGSGIMLSACALFIANLIALAQSWRTGGQPDSKYPHDRVVNAIESPLRPEADRADDALRRPIDVLLFSGIEPGMSVFEMEAGRGYYTELISELVGRDGRVIMQSPPNFDSFLADAITQRLTGNRLANVRLSKTPFDALDAPDGSVDLVTWFLGPHELYFTPAAGGSLGDVKKTYAEIFRILKPGGTFVVLDHAPPPGAPAATGDTLHRIDPAIVKASAENAGFILIAESDAMRNANDEYDKSVFDPAVRRKTDRFLLKYQKPDHDNDTG